MVRNAVLLFSFFLGLHAGELGPETRNTDALHMDLDVTVNFAESSVRGVCTWRLKSTVDELRTVRLHCEDTVVESVRYMFGAMSSEPVAGYYVEDGELVITLPEKPGKGIEIEGQPRHSDVMAGDILDLEITYRAKPTLGLFFFHPTKEHPQIPYQIWSQGEGEDNHHWFPCYDKPDDRHSQSLTVHVPTKYGDLIALANGKPAEPVLSEDGEERVFRFDFESDLPSYLTSLIVGDFDVVTERWEDVPLQYLVPPGWGERAVEIFGRTPNMMEFFSQYLDCPYPYSRYSQTVVWDFAYGGMENTTVTTLNARALYTGAVKPNYTADWLIAHELVHMWFGDWLTCKTWPHLWLNEGFATYFTDLWAESYYGADFMRYRRWGVLDWYLEGTSAEKRAKLRRKAKEPLELPSGMNYNKGSAVLHMLRGVLGDDVFRRSMATWVARYPNRVVETDQLREVMEEVSGRDLAWFFDEWLYGAGHPVYRVSWDWDAPRDEVVLLVKQEQELTPNQGLFRMPVPVALHGPTAVLRDTLWVQEAEQSFRMAFPEKPDFVRFDEGGNILKEVHFAKDLAEWTRQLTSDPDPTGRLDAIRGLKAIGADEPIEVSRALFRGLESEYWFVRAEAATALGEMEEIDSALSWPQDDDPRVREEIARACGKHGQYPDPLKLDQHPYVRGAQWEALATNGRSTRRALSVLRTDSSYGCIVARGVVEGILKRADNGGLGDDADAILEALIDCVDYDREAGGAHYLARKALDAAVKIAPDDERTHEMLLQALDFPHFRVRRTAARSLGDLKVARSVPEILERWDHERDKRVKGALLNAARQAARDPDKEEEPSLKELTMRRDRLLLLSEIRQLEKKLEASEKSPPPKVQSIP